MFIAVGIIIFMIHDRHRQAIVKIFAYRMQMAEKQFGGRETILWQWKPISVTVSKIDELNSYEWF